MLRGAESDVVFLAADGLRLPVSARDAMGCVRLCRHLDASNIITRAAYGHLSCATEGSTLHTDGWPNRWLRPRHPGFHKLHRVEFPLGNALAQTMSIA